MSLGEIEDEAKSKHVDFTCVRVKTDTDPESEAATLVGYHLARDPEESLHENSSSFIFTCNAMCSPMFI